MGRLRRREVIPEDTAITAVLTGPKLVFGKFGRQVETTVRVVEGEFKGIEFKNWFTFGRDKETEEEYISYGGPLYHLLAMVNDDLDGVLEDNNLSNRDYEKFLKASMKKLEGQKILARVGVKAPQNNPEKKRNTLQAGTVGPYRDPGEDFEAIDMGDSKAGVETPAPF